MNSEQPTHGVRFELLAQTFPPPGAVAYDVTLTAADASWTGRAAVTVADGAVQLDLPPEVPAWAASTLNAFLRSEWRARRGADAEPWPQRLTRWRAPREG